MKWTDETYICDFCGSVQVKEKPCGKCGHLWLFHPTTAIQKAHNATLQPNFERRLLDEICNKLKCPRDAEALLEAIRRLQQSDDTKP